MMGFEPIPRFSRERILSPLGIPGNGLQSVKIVSRFAPYETSKEIMAACPAACEPSRRRRFLYGRRRNDERETSPILL
jgi:hypothetical protein